MVHRSTIVEAAGTSVVVFCRIGTAHVGGVNEVFRVRGQDGQIEITAIRGGLEGVGGGGQVRRATAGKIGAASPPRQVDLVAVADEEGGGADVDAVGGVHARPDVRLPCDVAQIFKEPGDVLARFGIGIDASDHGKAGICLTEGVWAAVCSAVHEIHLVVGVPAVIGGVIGLNPGCRCGEQPHPAVGHPSGAGVTGQVAARGQRQVERGRTASYEHFKVAEVAETAVRGYRDAISRVVFRPPEIAAGDKVREVIAEPGNQAVLLSGMGWTARQDEVGGPGTACEPDGPVRPEIQLAPVDVAEVVVEFRGGIPAVGVVASEIGTAVKREIGSVEGGQEIIRSLGLFFRVEIPWAVGAVGDAPLPELGNARCMGGLIGVGGDGKVQGSGGTHDGDGAGQGVEGQAVGYVVVVSAQVGAVEQGVPVRTEDGQADVAVALDGLVVARLQGIRGDGVSRREYDGSRHEGRIGTIARRGAPVVTRGSDVAGEDDLRVNDEWQGRIERPIGQPDFLAIHDIPTRNRGHAAILLQLIGKRRLKVGGEFEGGVMPCVIQAQLAILFGHRLDTVITPGDVVRVCTGLNGEFELGVPRTR